MTLKRPVLFATCLGLLVPLTAQEPDVMPAPSNSSAAAPVPAKTAEQWISELGSDSYRKRLEAERGLRKLGAAALPALKKAAADSDDAEVQWRAARVARQIEGDGKTGLTERQRGSAAAEPEVMPGESRPGESRPKAVDQDPMRSRFESLFEQFERDFGMDIPRARFFGDGFFRDLQEQMKSGGGRSQGMSVQVGPDGAVHVEVAEANDKGEIEKKIYDAPDLETFRREHPGVLQQNGLGLGLSPWGSNSRVWSGPIEPGWAFDIDPLQRRVVPFDGRGARSQPDAEPAPAPVAGRRLGVTIRPQIAPEVREYLGLDTGIGLMVDEVQEGSLGKALELQRGDIVVDIAGKPIGSAQDVQAALAPIEQGQPVEVKFVRKGRSKTATAAKTEPAAPLEKAKLEKRGKTDPTIR